MSIGQFLHVNHQRRLHVLHQDADPVLLVRRSPLQDHARNLRVLHVKSVPRLPRQSLLLVLHVRHAQLLPRRLQGLAQKSHYVLNALLEFLQWLQRALHALLSLRPARQQNHVRNAQRITILRERCHIIILL